MNIQDFLKIFEPRWVRITLLSSAGFVLLLILILAVTGSGDDDIEIPMGAYAPIQETTVDLKLSDFMIDDPLPLEEPDWTLARPPRDKWSREEVERFWVDPVKIGIEELEKQNKAMVDDFFEKIP